MRFIVNSKTLSDSVQALSGVLNSKNTLPIFDHMIFELTEGQIKIYASDNETIIRKQIELENSEGEGKVAIPARLLLDILKALGTNSVTVNIENNRAELTSGNGHYQLTCMKVDGFPEVPQMEAKAQVKLNAPTLANAITKTIFATGTDEMRPMMTGVCCNLIGNDVIFVATDAHKMVRYTKRNVSEEEHVQTSFILPKKPLNLLKSNLPNDDEVEVLISVGDSNAIFEFDNMLISCRLVEGTFPDYERVIPTNNSNILNLDRRNFEKAVARVSIFANRSTYSIRLKISGQELLISAEDLEYDNAAEERISCSYSGEDMEIGFNSRILKEMLNNLSYDEISLQMSEYNRAGIIVPAAPDENEDEDILMLIMPVMLSA